MNLTPRVAAVHDMSGLGRCSLTVALPVLSAMGAQCCPLPTAVLSAHTAFPASHLATFLDLTDEMERMLLHWRKLHVSFDAIYSGFLGSEQQIGILHRPPLRVPSEGDPCPGGPGDGGPWKGLSYLYP